MKSLTITVNLARFDEPSEVRCADCQSPLAIHQPDCDAPERLLGTCATCRNWFLMNCVTSMMILLPVQTLLALA